MAGSNGFSKGDDHVHHPSTSSHIKRDTAKDAALTEITPLLPVLDHASPESDNPQKSTRKQRGPLCLMITVMVAVLLMTAADQLGEAPQTRIFESIICYKYYEEKDPSKLLLSRAMIGAGAIGGVDEALCKVAPIQSQVANIIGYLAFFSNIPPLFLSIPFGIMADKMGRRPLFLICSGSFVFRLAWIQIVCWFWQYLPLKLVWLASIHGIFGGGSPVLSFVVMVILTDVTSEAGR